MILTVTDEVTKRLKVKGFTELNERKKWNLKPGGKYYFTRNESTIVAFVVGEKYEPGNGVIMIGAHTDSPCLKLKPVSKVTKSGYNQVGVQCYGGGLWTTWFDRDLTVAGRVIVNRNGKPSHELVRVPKSVCRIPSLAIHLERGSGTDFKINKETHLNAVLESVSYPLRSKAPHAEMKVSSSSSSDNNFAAPSKLGQSARTQHHFGLLDLVAKELKCNIEDIIDVELQLCDLQDSALGGVCDEFVYVLCVCVYVCECIFFCYLSLYLSSHHNTRSRHAYVNTLSLFFSLFQILRTSR